MKTLKIIGLAVVLNLFAISFSFAQVVYPEGGFRIGGTQFKDVPGVRLGQATFKSILSMEERYETNIFWTPTDKKDDIINVITPMVLMDLPLGLDERHLLQLMYKGEVGSFSTHESENYINQMLAFNSNINLPFGYLNIQNNFQDTSDRAATEFTNRVERIENKASAALGIELNKLAFETGFSDAIKDYDDSNLDTLEYREDVVSETAFYQLFPKTKALLEYNHGFLDYFNNASRNGDYDQIRVGLKGDLTGKTQGIVKGGYQNRSYDVEGNSGYNGFVAEAGLVTKFSERTELNLKYVKNAVESTFANNNFYDTNYFSANLSQKLMGRWSLSLTSEFSRNIYPEVITSVNQKRRDSILNEEAAFKYDIKDWGQAKVGYQYRQDASSIDTQDYIDHICSVSFAFKI